MLDTDTSERPRRRTALIDIELETTNIDIAALQETRLSGEGMLRERERTFYWVGLPEGQRRTAGVAFAIKNDLADKLTENPKGISERIITMRIEMSRNRNITLINVYAPTMTYPDETKEAFYAQLREVIANVPATDKLVLLGDFNARVGNDSATWGSVLGQFGRGNSNENGCLLLSLCSELELAIVNTYFKQPENHFFSWTHPRSKRPHLLDYIIVKRRDLADTKNVRAMRGPDCQTDHYLIKATCKFSIKPSFRRTTSQRKRRLDTSKLADPRCRLDLQQAIDGVLGELPEDYTSPEEMWKSMSQTVFTAATEVLGYNKKKNADWFNENEEDIKKIIEERNSALQAKLRDPSAANQEKLRRVRALVQRKLREMEDNWWLEKAEHMQLQADTNNSAGFFGSLREVYGPKAQMTNILLTADGSTTLSQPEAQIDRWREHFETLLNVEASTDDGILSQIEALPLRTQLDAPPTIEEVEIAIEKTKSNKAPGIDGIPAEVYKLGGEQLIRKLHALILKCWQQETIPQDFKDVLIVPIYKNKGDHRDCGNYRGISLLVIGGKVMAKVLQARLAELAEGILNESQCGFRPERSTIDMIFSLRQVQEKCIEQYKELYIVFVDFRKAFDSVDRQMLWKVLRVFGCPDRFINIIRQFHEGTMGRVVVGKQESSSIQMNHGTKQGCVLAPTLFTLFLTIVLEILHQQVDDGIYIRTRSDGKLFNLARLRARTKTQTKLITELLFADDTALIAHDPTKMQQMVDVFSETTRKLGLQINIGKTEVMYQPSPSNPDPHEPVIKIDDEPLKVVQNFKYLGSMISSDNAIDREINGRIQSASAAFGKLEKRLWKRNGVRLPTKCKVYKAIVVPALLYSAETYTLYRKHIRKLEAVQQRHLRRIMGVRWSDYISNVEVLRRAGLHSIEATLANSQLRWAGHVARMREDRIPKTVFYGELAEGRRRVGGQKLRYKDVAKRHMKSMNIDVNGWEELAADRTKWRSALYRGREVIEEKITNASNQRHYRRHNPGTHQCRWCGQTYHTAKGLHQHQRLKHRIPPSHRQP